MIKLTIPLGGKIKQTDFKISLKKYIPCEDPLDGHHRFGSLTALYENKADEFHKFLFHNCADGFYNKLLKNMIWEHETQLNKLNERNKD